MDDLGFLVSGSFSPNLICQELGGGADSRHSSVDGVDPDDVDTGYAYDDLGARHVTKDPTTGTGRRPWQLLRATVTRVIVRTPFPVSYGCADRDWPEIGVYHPSHDTVHENILRATDGAGAASARADSIPLNVPIVCVRLPSE